MMQSTALGKRRWESMSAVANPLKEIRGIIEQFSTVKSKKEKIDKEKEGKLLDQGFLEFMELKAANLVAQMGTEKKKSETQTKKQQVDVTNLQLHNLNYEKDYYNKQIRNCKDIKLSYDKIDLVSEEEFLKQATPENIDKSNAHKLMLSRLKFELAERQRLCGELDELRAKKDEQSATNDAKSNFMGGLLSKLKGIEEATLPIQQELKITTSKTTSEYVDAQHLPRALYTLYVQAVSFKDAFEDNVCVSIEGDVSTAINLKAKEAEDAKKPEEDLREDQEAEEGKEIRRTKSKNNVEQEFGLQIDSRHPLSVVVDIQGSVGEKSASVQLQFVFLRQLNVISVKSKWNSKHRSGATGALLVNLFPEDPGLLSPNPANAQWLPSKSTAWDPQLPGRPYRWAQQLAGLSFEGIVQQGSEPSEVHFRAVVSRVKARIASNITLRQELSSLEAKKPTLTKAQKAQFQMAATATISSWSLQGQDEDTLVRVFEAVLERGPYKLKAEISVSPAYPVEAPYFKLRFTEHPAPPVHAVVPGIKIDLAAARLAQGDATNNNLEAIGEEVNVHFDSLLAMCGEGQAFNLLSLQLRRLQMCFDIYVSTEHAERGKSGRICFRPERGRARKKPFEYNAQSGLFDQRR